MNIAILLGSPRPKGNSDLLADAFAAEAAKKHEVHTIALRDYNIHPCKGCNACMQPPHLCAQHDDMTLIYPLLQQADMLVMASPVYFYNVSAQLKTCLDRLHTPLRNSFHIQKTALLLTAASLKEHVCQPAILQYQLLVNNFNLQNIGIIATQGVKEPGEVLHTTHMGKARQMAQKL